MKDIADYIVVGAGSAGAAIAFRLAEAGHEVIVVEHGGGDRSPLIRMPGALSYPMNMRRYDWGFATDPEPHLGGRRLPVPRGKVIGGSSSINGMVFVRGNPVDFDHWSHMGADGWDHASVLPYFKRMETWHGGSSDLRGTDGPLHVTRADRSNPLHAMFREAGRQAGHPATDDYNGAQQDGFGAMERTIWRGTRWSTAQAYLRPALAMPNCTLRRGLALRVTFEGDRATGLEIAQGRRRSVLNARREVIVAASSINSPKLLMLSGIGDERHLRDHGIDVRAHRPGVGRNLQDHLELYLQMESRKPISLYSHWNLFGKARVGLEWLLTGGGIGASNQFDSAAFLRSDPSKAYPDLQYHFLPLAVRYDGKAAKGHGFQAHVGPMRSQSRGAVRLASSDPAAAPSIRFNYMSHDDDWKDFRRAIEMTRDIFAQQAFDDVRGAELQPGSHVRSKEDLDDFIREHVESAYHPCGTCRMGRASDPDAVVDPETRVIGVENLRVVDSSIFPRIPNGNLNAPSIMTGEKAADHVLGLARPVRDELAA
ncbi:choline dehydrogenase [Palleronia sp. LCG004]|uniref:choline dehydrogenase n=1 Tax=Palleronia sp. LCG004 TaxID=3079304 RepID=UPI0029439316|nr:choline dehydrogenase [Palleronia sp. LCG004]WOI57543.1 choline dehydrogenase [Palleronia sp. LCG004]